MSSGSPAGVQKTKDGVPIWDGDPSTYVEYAESARLFEQAVAPHKRAQVGPRLASELSGAAKKFIVGQDAEWLSFHGGVGRLLDHLRQGLGQPKVAEIVDHLNRYFKNSKRKTGESINEYLARKNESYPRAQQAATLAYEGQEIREHMVTTLA